MFPELETERLLLEPLSRRHSAGMFTLWASPEVCRHSGEAHDEHGAPIVLPARTPLDSDKIVDFFVARALAGTGVRWALLTKATGRIVGAVGFNALESPAELAYHLCADCWGRGYAREACQAVLQWVRVERGVATIEAFVDAENEPSSALAGRLGFVATPDVREGARRYVLEAS